MTFVAPTASYQDSLASIQAALAAAEARVAGSTQRLLDALQAAGLARDDIGRMAEESVWLRSLIAEAKETAAKSRAEAAWLRDQMEATRTAEAEQAARLLARVEETGWLRGCLADAEARISEEVRKRAEAEARAHGHAMEVALLRASPSWQITAPLRRWQGTKITPLPITEPDVTVPSHVPPVPIPPLLPLPLAGEGRGEGRLASAQPAAADGGKTADIRPSNPPVPSDLRPPAAESEALPLRHQKLVGTVHQFHAGSAVGDAITNAMLLIRAQLRAAGFRSDIYVAHRGPGLGRDIRLLDSIPEHDGYVLLLHHSMGFPGFDRVVALAAAKILIYHNITPPKFLAGIPRVQRLAEIGRTQLAALPGQVAFALADSDYNATELHRLGFAAIRTCPLLFDVAALARSDAEMRPEDGVFTVLFVGRVTPSKAQDALVDAFAVFRQRFGQPCRLVLAGALDADEHAFITMIRERIAVAGLDGHVQLTGLVSGRELHDWYRQADLYVSLSHHEGFGVPLVEAMAQGIPVVAWPTGAVPFTLGGAGRLLTARNPAAVAEAMLDAMANRQSYSALGTSSIARWALDRQMPVLLQALATAGAVPPRAYGQQDVLAANLQVTICGHMAKSYSLAAVNRGLARTLEAQRPGSVRIVPVEGTLMTNLREVPSADRPLIASLARRGESETGPVLVLSGHYPLHVPAERGDLVAALVFWEESLLPEAMVATLNADFEAVFAPSRTVAKALVDSGVSVPVVNVGQAPDLSAFAALDPDRERTRPFIFLHVSSAFPRKGLDVLLAAWARSFTAGDGVRLVIKTFPNPHNDAAAQIARLCNEHPGLAPIELVDEDLPPDALLALYRDADAMVLPTRGEGFNLPAAEAMAAGLPVILTAHGGHMDFCTPDTTRLLRRRFAFSNSHVAPPRSLWAEPDADDLVAALREAASGALAGLAAPARRAIAAHTDPVAFTARLSGAAARLLLEPPRSKLRLTWVTSWAIRCGIAEYSSTLLDSLKRDGLPDPILLADSRVPPGTAARVAWQLGDGMDGLLAAIAKADGDVTMIQHQPALLAWPSLGRLLEGLADAGQTTVVTLHNTADLMDVDDADRIAAIQGLGRAARLLVHTLADIERLDALGLSGVTTLLPHPAPPPANAPVRALPDDAAPVIGCTGFFLPGKGIDTLIAVTARLRKRWPGVRLRLVNAEYDDPASAAEIAACRRLARSEGLAVEWHTDFVPAAEQLDRLRGCDLIVLPYQQSKEAASGAVRAALATGIPVAVTPLPLFDEAAGAVFRLPGMTAPPIQLGISSLLDHPERRTALAAAGREWLAARSFPATARRLHGLLQGLAAQGRAGQATDGSLWRG